MARYIDADKLLKSGLHYSCGIDDERGMFVLLGDVLKSINEMPTADVEEVKHCEWIPLENDEFQCSGCGNRAASSNPSIDVTRDLHRCWSCGAKMDKRNLED